MVIRNFGKFMKFANFFKTLYQKDFGISDYEFHRKIRNYKFLKFWFTIFNHPSCNFDDKFKFHDKKNLGTSIL